MSSQSPASVLYDSTGTALAVYNNTALVASQPAVLFAGSDGYNTRNLFTTKYGAMFGAEASNNIYIFNNATITSSGSTLIENSYFGTQQINLIVNVSAAPTGTTPTLTFTIQELDPGDEFTVFGSPVSTAVINGTGVFTAVLTNTHSSSIKVSWTIGGTGGPTFTGVYVTVTTKGTPDTQAISGSITANNASVSTTNTAPPGSATYIGGSVTTSAPSYTNGTMNALSLDTSGNLRTVVDNTVTVSVTGTVGVTQSTSPWIVAGGGTAGSPASGVVTIQGIAGMTHLGEDGYAFATSAAPSYSNSSWNPLSVDLAGNLRVTGFVTTNKAATSAVTSVAQSTSNTVLLSSNANRLFASIYNNTGQKMFIKLGTTANTTTSYTIQLMPNSYWEVPSDYTGEIDAVWSGNGSSNALITELTP